MLIHQAHTRGPSSPYQKRWLLGPYLLRILLALAVFTAVFVSFILFVEDHSDDLVPDPGPKLKEHQQLVTLLAISWLLTLGLLASDVYFLVQRVRRRLPSPRPLLIANFVHAGIWVVVLLIVGLGLRDDALEGPGPDEDWALDDDESWILLLCGGVLALLCSILLALHGMHIRRNIANAPRVEPQRHMDLEHGLRGGGTGGTSEMTADSSPLCGVPPRELSAPEMPKELPAEDVPPRFAQAGEDVDMAEVPVDGREPGEVAPPEYKRLDV